MWGFISQRQIMEQKMRQKRQASGMIQASDMQKTSARMQLNNGNRRELHGNFKRLVDIRSELSCIFQDTTGPCSIQWAPTITPIKW